MFRSPVPTSTPAAPSQTSCLRRSATSRAYPVDPRIQEQFQDPALKVDFNRELAGVVGLTESRCRYKHSGDVVGQHADGADLLAEPDKWRAYPVSVQTPQYGIDTLGELKNLPLTAAQSTQLLGGLATFSPEPTLEAVVSHYDIRPVVNIYATTQGRDLGSVSAADVQKIVDDLRADLPRGRAS